MILGGDSGLGRSSFEDLNDPTKQVTLGGPCDRALREGMLIRRAVLDPYSLCPWVREGVRCMYECVLRGVSKRTAVWLVFFFGG